MRLNVISSTDIDRGLVDGLILAYKAPGETPLEVLYKLRLRFPILAVVPLSYAGRLDPLASGLLLVLSGAFNKMRDSYLGLEKTYAVKVLFGVSTDTGDFMGFLQKGDIGAAYSDVKVLDFNIDNDIESAEFRTIINSFLGEHEFPYPAYSSKTVDGKPLHEYAREGTLGDIEMPMQKASIKSIELIDKVEFSGDEIAKRAIEAVSVVNGDFRQQEIMEKWKVFAKENGDKKYVEVLIRVRCGSGTYMRTLADQLGKRCGTVALASSIVREKVGDLEVVM